LGTSESIETGRKSTAIEGTDLYIKCEAFSDEVWLSVKQWDWFDKKTVGIQLCESIDSIGANLVEGDGRHYEKDCLRVFIIARGSAREARYWVRRAVSRRIVPAEMGERWIDEMRQILLMVQGLVRYRLKKSEVKESRKPFGHSNGTLINPFENEFNP
jgi:four helix bundle protein